MTPFRALVRPLGPRGAAALALVAGLLGAAPAPAQQPQQPPPPNREVTVQNENDLILFELYFAPANAAERGPDRLGSDVIAPGGTYRVRLGRTRDCVFNVTAVWQGGGEEVRQRLDICRIPRVVFGDPALPTLDATIGNTSRVALRELYVARAAAGAPAQGAWGPNRLLEPVDPAGSFALRLRTRDCAFNLRAVYADNREETRQGVDLCQSRAVAFDRSGVPRPPTRSVVLANRHLAPVQEIYVSASTDADWGPNRLDGDTLARGDDASVEMEGGCEADLRIVFPNGGAEERREVDVCETPRIVLRPGWVVAERLDEDDAVNAPPATAAAGALRVRNAGPLPIVEIYARRPGGLLGADRLGADTLPIGGTIEIEPTDPSACTADLLAVFRDGREVTRPGVDLCAGEEIEIR